MDSYETKIYIAILIAASIIGIILIYFIITIIRHQRKHTQLQKEKILAEITTLENERKRIVTDLHDELGPLLSAVKLQINSLETSIADDHKLIDKASVHLDDVLTRIREISNDLMPQALLRKGVLMALQEFISELNASSSLHIEFHHPENISISKDKEIHIYRILQEIINNTVKHAQASFMELKVEQQTEKLIIKASDNGNGFSYEAILKDNAGLGLKNVLSRVDVLKGDLYIDTKVGKGTHYTIEIPN